MTETLYVIATRGKNGKEIYLACDNDRSNKSLNKIYYLWSENIDEAVATFSYSETEKMANNYFKNFNKWYVKSYNGIFK